MDLNFLYNKAIKSVNVNFIKYVQGRIAIKEGLSTRFLALQERALSIEDNYSGAVKNKMNILLGRFETYLKNIGFLNA